MEYIILIKYMAWNYLAIAMGDKDYWKYESGKFLNQLIYWNRNISELVFYIIISHPNSCDSLLFLWF